MCCEIFYNVLLFYQRLFAEDHMISKTALNLLNIPDEPCDENGGKISIQECIKDGIEKSLNCIIPDISSGDAVAPHNKSKRRLCSSSTEFKNYMYLYDKIKSSSNQSPEAAIFNNLGCTASCQECTEKGMNTNFITNM